MIETLLRRRGNSSAKRRPRGPAQPEAGVILAALAFPVIVIDRAGQIRFVNPAAEQFFGSGAAALRGSALADLVAPHSPLLALVDSVWRIGNTISEHDILLEGPRFGGRVVTIQGAPTGEGADMLVLTLYERSMAEMMDRHLTHRNAARSITGMAAMLAHEVKNPLSGIRGAAQLLEPGLKDDDRALARLICTETDRIRNLVDRMEVFGDERPLSTEPVNIHAILDHVKRLAESGFAGGIKMQVEYDPTLPPLAGNRDKLIQAFLNLVKNAAEAIEDGREGGRIILRTAFRPGVRMAVPGSSARVGLPLMIEVEDSGPGIGDTHKPHLFDPFVTTKRKGTGLGLALVAKIIGDHGGVIECESVPKRTVFRVLLPLQDKPRRGR